MRRKRFRGLLLLLCLLGACQRQSPADQLRAELKATASWAATARMAGEKWSSGAVPTHYARRTLEAAQETLQESLNILNTSNSSTADDLRLQLQSEIQRLLQLVAEMRSAVEEQNRSAMAEQLEQLSALEREVADLKKATGA